MGEDYKGKSIVDAGASIAGGVAGAAVRILFPDPLSGAAVGAVVSETTKRTISEFASRLLSSREEARIGAAISYATLKIQQKLEAGDIPRSDGFFEKDATGRSDADEVLEGVLLKAKNENQEKKLKFLGNLYANIAFSPDISSAMAAFLLKTAESLTYRQFCFLSLVGQEGSFDANHLRLWRHSIADLEALKREEMSLHSTDLGTIGLIKPISDFEDVLSPMGKIFYDLLGLQEIPKEDLDALKQLLDKSIDAAPKPRSAA